MATHQKGPAERRYHKIAVALWGGREFRGLSERAKLLYLRLAVGPETSPVPGVTRISRYGLAMDELGWGLEEFDSKLRELQKAGLAEVDLDVGLVVLPRELAEPFSMPNGLPSVTSWRRGLANLPDCDLLEQVRERVLAMLGGRGPRWVAAFCTAGDDGTDSDGEQPALFPRKLPPPVPTSVPPKVHIQNQKQTQSQKGEAAPARELSATKGEEPAASTWRAVTLPPGARGVDEVPDLTGWAEEEVAIAPPPVPGRTERARPKLPATPPPPPAKVQRPDPKQASLSLMAPPDPEHCAWVVVQQAGRLFAHGPLLPGSENRLGGELHPSVRREWQRVLADYFGPLHYTPEQVDQTLTALGKWIANKGETVTLQALVKWRGERLQQYIAAALAWSGAKSGAGPARAAKPAAEGRRYPVHSPESRRGLAAAAVLGAVHRQIERTPSAEDDAAAQQALATLRQLAGIR